jgi:phosphoenolpyruvate phosphomutase
MDKKVYTGFSADTLHNGHINLIKKARKYGKVIVGLLTDKAVTNYKRLPLLNYEQRKEILENISGVSEVVPQKEWDYTVNIKKYKPDYVVHGDDWMHGPELNLRKNVIKELKKYGGKLIEVPYTKGVSSYALSLSQTRGGVTSEHRLKTLRRCLSAKNLSKFIETHSPISALIVEKAVQKVKNKTEYFDGFWSSSLTDATNLGKPDNEVLDLSERLNNINQIFEVTNKPLIMDIDTGGQVDHLKLNIRSVERLGISAIIMEDKTGLKRNSLLGKKSLQVQEEINLFCEKIKVIKLNQINKDFMVIARIESLILEKGMRDAISRARAYTNSGADGIMIHSRKKNPKEIFEFANKYRRDFKNIPLVCVPTSYNSVREDELVKHGFNIVIYANHLFRAAYPAMQKTVNSILKNGRSKEADRDLMKIKEILELIPGTK